MDKDVSQNIINVLFDNSNIVHESCLKNILVVNDLVLKKSVLRRQMFFYDQRKSIYSCKMQSIDNWWYKSIAEWTKTKGLEWTNELP